MDTLTEILKNSTVKIDGTNLLIAVASMSLADQLLDSADNLAQMALSLQRTRILIDWCGNKAKPFCIPAKAVQLSISNQKPKEPESLKPNISSYGASCIAPEAKYDEVMDFIKGQKADGKVVTVTSMISDKCLLVNDLQVSDRGGGWTADNWIGLDFKNLWRDSFHVGRANYYGELLASLQRDGYIPEFHYQIRRPSDALAEYSSTYHLIDEFMGIPVRIACSVPGEWRIVEASKLES